MRVKDLADALSVSAETVRFYTRNGLLSPSKNPQNGYKEYSQNDLTRMNFILSARTLGFTVKDITEILAVADSKDSPCPLVRELIEKRLSETEKQYRETCNLRARMHAGVKRWTACPMPIPPVT